MSSAIKFLLLTIAAAAVCLVEPLPAATAGGGCLNADSQANAFYVHIQCHREEADAPVAVLPSSTHTGGAINAELDPSREICDLITAGASFPVPFTEPMNIPPECLPSEPNEPSDPVADFDAAVLQAVRRVKPPKVEVIIEPPGGKTLVNFDTIFRAEAAPYTTRVRLLGRRVLLRITPSRFTWHHGDATQQTTDWGGQSYRTGVSMDRYITHRYTDAGVTVRPWVGVTYAARFSLDGGASWRGINGTVTIPGPQSSLRVLEARPVLVAG